VSTETKRVLFVCVENSCRSQMAEAFARRLGAGRIEASSAGSRPAGHVHPEAIASMRRVGYDIATQDSKSVDSLTGRFDAIVTMGCGDACPSLPAVRRLDWQIPDPKGLPAAEFDAVRDRIEAAVRALLVTL
jgi:protein-tyrosine-phosphatase